MSISTVIFVFTDNILLLQPFCTKAQFLCGKAKVDLIEKVAGMSGITVLNTICSTLLTQLMFSLFCLLFCFLFDIQAL